MEARLDQLELDTNQPEKSISSSEERPKSRVELVQSPDLKDTSRPAAVMGMMKGRSYGTFFYGPSSAMSVIAHVSAPVLFDIGSCASCSPLRYSPDRYWYPIISACSVPEYAIVGRSVVGGSIRYSRMYYEDDVWRCVEGRSTSELYLRIDHDRMLTIAVSRTASLYERCLR
jgi:hypothetical protein